MTTATNRLTTASSFDDDYPACTMGRAAEMTATTAGSRHLTRGPSFFPSCPTGSPGCAYGAGRRV